MHRPHDRVAGAVRRTPDHAARAFIGAEFDSIFGQTPEAVLETRAHIPNLREPVWVKGSGHWIQQEKPAVVNDALLAFLHESDDQ